MISFASVSKQYGRQVIFVDASFQLNPGEKAGLVGPNGSGKTTLLRVLLGNEDANAGEIKWGANLNIGYYDQRRAHFYYPEYLHRDGEKVPLPNRVREEPRSPGAGPAVVRGRYSHDAIAEEALAFLDRHRREPFFLYVPVTIPHAELQAPDVRPDLCRERIRQRTTRGGTLRRHLLDELDALLGVEHGPADDFEAGVLQLRVQRLVVDVRVLQPHLSSVRMNECKFQIAAKRMADVYLHLEESEQIRGGECLCPRRFQGGCEGGYTASQRCCRRKHCLAFSHTLKYRGID
jgi:energy-coupling factor transporter ATP-binding protein EcfA2